MSRLVLGIDTIGTHEWYWRGAEELVKRQQKNGAWKQSPRETGSGLEWRMSKGTGR